MAAVKLFNRLFSSAGEFVLTITCEALDEAAVQTLVSSMEQSLASIPQAVGLGTPEERPKKLFRSASGNAVIEKSEVGSTDAEGLQLLMQEQAEPESNPGVQVLDFPPGLSQHIFLHGTMQGAQVQMMWPAM